MTGKRYEQISYWLSGLCVIHCLLTPIIILLLPGIATFFSSTIEFILVMLIIPFALLGFLPKWLKHRNYKLLFSFLIGMILIISSRFFHTVHDATTGFASVSLTSTAIMFLGAIILAITIYKSNRHVHHCNVPGHHHH